MGLSARTEDNIEKIIEAIEMNTKAVAHLNQNLSMIANELKEMKTEMQGMRRNTSFLRNLCEIFNRELKDYAKEESE